MFRSAVAGALVLLLIAIGAAASSASAAKLTLSEGGVALAPGQPVYGEEGYVTVYTSDGAIECNPEPEFELGLSVVTNSKESDELALETLFERQETCRSFTGNAEVLLRSLGSVLKINAKGKASVGLDPTLELFFEHVEYGEYFHDNVECVYRRGTLHGTSTATPSREPLQVGLEDALPLRAALSSAEARHLCPAKAELTISFSIDGETGPIEEQTST
jgi:hypothetical protein